MLQHPSATQWRPDVGKSSCARARASTMPAPLSSSQHALCSLSPPPPEPQPPRRDGREAAKSSARVEHGDAVLLREAPDALEAAWQASDLGKHCGLRTHCAEGSRLFG
eukprot:2422251-Alexandrium_andersonii.AAC.2